jgi:hypothetical protein
MTRYSNIDLDERQGAPLTLALIILFNTAKKLILNQKAPAKLCGCFFVFFSNCVLLLLSLDRLSCNLQ